MVCFPSYHTMEEWIGPYKLRQDGPEEGYVSIGLGSLGQQHEQIRPGKMARIRVIDENTIKIEIMED